MVQIAANLRTIPDGACGHDCQTVTTALQRVQRAIDGASGRLFTLWAESLGQPPTPTSSAGWAKLQRCFGIAQDDPLAGIRIELVRGVYDRAATILSSPRCLISRITDPAIANGWGFSPIPPAFHPAAGFDYEIQVGQSFLDHADPGFDSSVQQCGFASTRDLGLLRVTTLVHEAVHWANGQGGHTERGQMFNPFNYELFILDLNCNVPALFFLPPAIRVPQLPQHAPSIFGMPPFRVGT